MNMTQCYKIMTSHNSIGCLNLMIVSYEYEYKIIGLTIMIQ